MADNDQADFSSTGLPAQFQLFTGMQGLAKKRLYPKWNCATRLDVGFERPEQAVHAVYHNLASYGAARLDIIYVNGVPIAANSGKPYQVVRRELPRGDDLSHFHPMEYLADPDRRQHGKSGVQMCRWF